VLCELCESYQKPVKICVFRGAEPVSRISFDLIRQWWHVWWRRCEEIAVVSLPPREDAA